MRKMSTLLVAPIAAAALTVGAGSAAEAAVAKAPVHHFTFTKKHEYFSHTDSVGSFHAQVAVKRPFRGYPMPWSFRIGRKLQAIATSRATCVAGGLNGHYHDKHVVPVGYIWHSTVKPHRAKKVYRLWGSCTFRVRVAGRPGVAHVGFTFNYAIDPSSRNRLTGDDAAQAIRTTVRISR